MIETVRPGAPFYPYPEVGAPIVDTTIDPDLIRQGTALYSFPTADSPVVDNTVGSIIITGQPGREY